MMGSLPRDIKAEEVSITMLKIERDLDRVGIWRSDESTMEIPELGIESVSSGSRPGLFGTFCSLGDLIRKMYYDLCVKQSLGQGELRESLQRLLKGEMSVSLIVSDPHGFLFKEEADEEEEEEEKETSNSTEDFDDVDIVQDEEQASILASFINRVNREAADERDAKPKPGTQISVLWPPDGKYYAAVVLSHEHNANLPGIAVLYHETGEMEQGVRSFRIK